MDPLSQILSERGELTFNQAFAQARARGDRTFEWKNPSTGRVGMFTTQRADDKPRFPAGAIRMPAGIKESDIYRDVSLEARFREIEQQFQQLKLEREAEQALQGLIAQEASNRQAELEGEAAAALQGLSKQELEERAASALGELQQQELESQAASDLGELAAFEERETNESKAAESMATMQAYERREQQADMERMQALQRVYPELAAPAVRALHLAVSRSMMAPVAQAARVEPRLSAASFSSAARKPEPFIGAAMAAGAAMPARAEHLSQVENAYLNRLSNFEFPGETAIPDLQNAALGATVGTLPAQEPKTQPEASIRPIPRNMFQQAIGKFGEALSAAGVQLDKVGIDIPALGRVTLKDLTVGEAGKVIENMSYGFMPTRGAGGIGGTAGLKPEAAELLNVPIVGTAAKAAGTVARAIPGALPAAAAAIAAQPTEAEGGVGSPAKKSGNNVASTKLRKASKGEK